MAKKKTTVEEVAVTDEPLKDTGIDPCWKWHHDQPVLTCAVTIYLGGHRWAGHAEVRDTELQSDGEELKRTRLREAYLALHETVMDYLNG